MNIEYSKGKTKLTDIGNKYLLEEVSSETIGLIDNSDLMREFHKISKALSTLTNNENIRIEELYISCTDSIISADCNEGLVTGSIMASEQGMLTSLKTKERISVLVTFISEITKILKLTLEVNSNVSGDIARFIIP